VVQDCRHVEESSATDRIRTLHDEPTSHWSQGVLSGFSFLVEVGGRLESKRNRFDLPLPTTSDATGAA
jgi:hypothetical protein